MSNPSGYWTVFCLYFEISYIYNGNTRKIAVWSVYQHKIIWSLLQRCWVTFIFSRKFSVHSICEDWKFLANKVWLYKTHSAFCELTVTTKFLTFISNEKGVNIHEPEMCSAERVLMSAPQSLCCRYRKFWQVLASTRSV